MFKEDHLSFRQRKYMKVKNIIGRALGGIGLVVLSPVYLAIIVAIKKEDGITAPVFFSQKRVGIHKEYFNLYKFRSMRTDTPHDKPTHLLENPDQYITKVGRFLRKSSLDELPQLWNIARGDMAVIGPRPALWNQDDLIAERDKYGANDVKPGLTGWAQINGRDELEIPVKARLDGEYVKKMGPLMDIRCFIGTVFSVLRSDGVVEGGTGAKKKLMVITNHSYMLWQFRRELIGKLMEDYDVIISTPFVGHEDDFKAMGCTMIETDVDRRGINPKTDMKLYLTYRRLLKEHHPDMVVTYSIKPNVYAGYACRQMRIPYCVNVQGLGTAFQKKGLREIVIRMYKIALKKAKTVYFENKGNAKVFLQEQIIRREQMCLLKGAGVNLKYYTYQKYPENDKVHFLYDLDIQNYITISFDDLVNVIDEIGGVTVFISEEEAAYYRENGMPDIQAGDVTLTGSQALAHARNRTLGNDFERTRRQRSVMYGIYRKIMEKKDPSALLPLINYAVNHVKTNMSVSEMYSMAKDVLSVDDLKMQQTCIPQDGTYTDITYEGMQVLKVDFDANKKKIEQLLY